VLESPGTVLRAWRLHRGWTQAEVADLLNVAPPTVSTWESGVYRIPRDLLRRLDEEYDAGGALVDLVRAVGTPGAFVATRDGVVGPQPRRYWPRVLPEDVAPMWIWIRSASGGRVAGWVYSAASGQRLESGDADLPDGIFLSLAHWHRAWPLQVVLDEPGWVDVGRGVPPAWLDSSGRSRRVIGDPQLLDARDAVGHWFVEMIRGRDQGDPATLVERIRSLVGPERWARLEASWRSGRGMPEGTRIGGRPDDARPPATPAERREVHRRLREAHGLSRAAAAAAATAVLHDPARGVSEHQIYNYETGRGSRIRHLPAVLDFIYDAGGWTCFEQVGVRRSGPGSFEVGFPGFWLGPVALHVEPPTMYPTEARIDLVTEWWHSTRPLSQESRRFTYCRTLSHDPLRVTVPAGWTVRAYLGHDPDAIDAGDGWLPTERHEAESFAMTIVALTASIGKTPADLDRVLQRAGQDG
jgi:transcriptional regulator with XRE-family HTH domain